MNLRQIKNIDPVLALSILFMVVSVSVVWLSDSPVIWDESVYIGLGKFLWSGGAMGLYEPIRPLGLPLVLGAGWKIGLDPVLFGRIISAAFSAGFLVFVFVIGRNLFGLWSARLSVVLVAATPIFITQSAQILTEIPATTLFLGALVSIMKRQWFFAGLLVGCAAVFKFPFLLSILIFFLWLVIIREKKKIPPVLLGVILPLIFYLLANLLITQSVFEPLFLAARHGGNIAYAVQSPLHNWLFYIIEPIGQNPLVLFSLVGLWLFVKRQEYKKEHKLLLALFFMVYASYFTWIINKQMRFFLIFFPVVVLMSGCGLAHVLKYLAPPRIPIRRAFSLGVLAVVCVILFSLAAENVALLSEQAKWQDDRKEVYSLLSGNGPILTADPVPAAYLDEKFIPLYYSKYDAEDAITVYEREKENVRSMVFVPEVFGCEFYGDQCYDMVQELRKRLEAEQAKYYESDLKTGHYMVFRNRRGFGEGFIA